MRIAIFSENFYPELSGIADSILTTAKELARRNHEILFVVPRYSQRDYEKVGLQNAEPDFGPHIRIHRLPSLKIASGTGQGRVALPIGVLSVLRRWQPDILHTNLIGGAGLVALQAQRKLNLPLVGTSHTPFREFVHYSILARLFTQPLLHYVSRYYNHCDYVTAPSHFIFTEMVEYGFHQPHGVISNPIDTQKFFPADPSERQALKQRFGFSHYTILVVGRIAVEKRIDIILRAFAIVRRAFPDATLVIVGSGTNMGRLVVLAHSLGVAEAVLFFGYANQQQLSDLYRAADVYAISSTSETQSMSMMNAMASGIPVVAVAAGGLPEYATPDVGMVVEPGDVNAFAEKLGLLLGNSKQRDAMGASGRQWAEQFSISCIGAMWEELFQRIITP